MGDLVKLYPQREATFLKVRERGTYQSKEKFVLIKQIADFLSEYYLLKMNNKIFRWCIEAAGGLGTFIFILASGTEILTYAMIAVGIALSLVPAVMIVALLLDVMFISLYFICQKYIRIFKRFYPQKQYVKQQRKRSA